MFLDAESYFLFDEYKDALPLYQRLLSEDPDNANLNYKIGVCYLNDKYQKEKSIAYLKKAVENTSNSYRINSFKERNAPPEAYYYLGNAYRVNNFLNDALETYQIFKESVDPAIYDLNLVNKEIESCKRAIKMEQNPVYYEAENLQEPVNSRFSELNPLISGDETALVYTSELPFYTAVFYSKKQADGTWGNPINLTPYFGVDGNTYSTGISYKGDEIYVYRSDNFDGNIYVSTLNNGQWSVLAKLNENINTKFWESHATVSADGLTLYFTSNRTGGFGGLDIYKSTRTKRGAWGPAINLGPVINSPYNEETPFISGNGKLLFFSSFGHDNIGGYDIYYSALNQNNEWSKPKNIGYPINTTDDDMFFVPYDNGAFAYYSMFNSETTLGLSDIYKLQLFYELHPRQFVINGSAKPKGTNTINYNNLKAKLFNSKSLELVDESSINQDGSYQLNATNGEYTLVLSGEEIKTSEKAISLPINSKSTNINIEPMALEASITAEPQPEILKPGPVAYVPVLKVDKEYIKVTDDEGVQIRLNVEKGSKLLVEVYAENEQLSSEQFDINRRRFSYGFKPVPGKNEVRFQITDANGNINSKNVVVEYTPAVTEQTLPLPQKTALQKLNPVSSLLPFTSGKTYDYLAELNKKGGIKDFSELYELLSRFAEENNISQDSINSIFASILSQKSAQQLKNEMYDISGSGFQESLNTIQPEILNSLTSETLIAYLRNHPDKLFPEEELQNLLLRLTEDPSSAKTVLKQLKNYAGPETLNKLQSINPTGIDNQQLLGELSKLLSKEELWRLLTDAAASEPLSPFFLNLLFVAEGGIKEALSETSFEQQGIKTSRELIDYLFKRGSDYGYTGSELVAFIEEAQNNREANIERFVAILTNKATGTLKDYLTGFDPKKEKVKSFSGLLNKLVDQSRYSNFSIEQVYTLLTSLIEINNMEDFINKMAGYASGDLKLLLERVDKYKFSTPVELIQYLLSQRENYNYTENDINELLLRMILEKGIKYLDTGKELVIHSRSKQERNRLIVTLGIANVLILFFLFFLLFKRRKSKKDKKPDNKTV
ncbi:MAG: PD40 domain-containing protein [Bacteroidales bacterium]|nr:PD40 domain-containing protein [Bacteroidales bacterium]